MTTLFRTVFSARNCLAFVMAAVLLARLVFRRAPKRLTVALWAVVCFRLLCPVSIDAPVSLVPKAAEQAASEVEHLPRPANLPACVAMEHPHYIVNRQ